MFFCSFRQVSMLHFTSTLSFNLVSQVLLGCRALTKAKSDSNEKCNNFKHFVSGTIKYIFFLFHHLGVLFLYSFIPKIISKHCKTKCQVHLSHFLKTINIYLKDVENLQLACLDSSRCNASNTYPRHCLHVAEYSHQQHFRECIQQVNADILTVII